METWPYQRLRQLGFIDVHDYEYWRQVPDSRLQRYYTADLTSGKVKPKTENRPYFLWPVRGTAR